MQSEANFYEKSRICCVFTRSLSPHPSPRPWTSPSVALMLHWLGRATTARGLVTTAFGFFSTFTALTFSQTAHAERYLALEPMTGKSIQIDGMLREWPSGFASLSTGGAKTQSSVLVGYDEQHLYF